MAVVNLLLAKDADPNILGQVSPIGPKTGGALMTAVEGGKHEMMSILLQHGADASTPDVLQKAAERGDVMAMQCLLRKRSE